MNYQISIRVPTPYGNDRILSKRFKSREDADKALKRLQSMATLFPDGTDIAIILC